MLSLVILGFHFRNINGFHFKAIWYFLTVDFQLSDIQLQKFLKSLINRIIIFSWNFFRSRWKQYWNKFHKYVLRCCKMCCYSPFHETSGRVLLTLQMYFLFLPQMVYLLVLCVRNFQCHSCVLHIRKSFSKSYNS